MNSQQTTQPTTTTPHATLLIGTHCPHCPTVLTHLSEMIKQGEIASLNIINIEQAPEHAQALNVRSVPWVKIGEHTLSGIQTKEALQQRVQWIQEGAALQGQFDQWLSNGQADDVINTLKDKPQTMQAIMQLLGDPATVLSTRIGIGVVIEEFAGSGLLNTHLALLSEFAAHDDVRIRADACHYLGMTANSDAIPVLKACLDDDDAEVREIASDSLEELSNE